MCLRLLKNQSQNFWTALCILSVQYITFIIKWVQQEHSLLCQQNDCRYRWNKIFQFLPLKLMCPSYVYKKIIIQ
jgi:hypothetical protein